MALIRPFAALRPLEDAACEVAALPYDVFTRREAKKEVQRHPASFLAIDRPETQFPDEYDMYAPEVCLKAGQLLEQKKEQGIFLREDCPCLYIYALTGNGRTQTGLAACTSVEEYENGTIRRHETTRKKKEEDRIRHIEACNAQTGPVFLIYRSNPSVKRILEREKNRKPLYDFVAEDGVRHQIWKISQNSVIEELQKQFEYIPKLYIADGHHRAAAAAGVCRRRLAENPVAPEDAPFRFFLSVLFPDDELRILEYNRIASLPAGMTAEKFLNCIRNVFDIRPKENAFRPVKKGSIGLYLENHWYCLEMLPERITSDPVESLDTAFLQREVLAPVLGILDPRTSPDLFFVGGNQNPKELERLCRDTRRALFVLYPVSLSELLAVADTGKMMPPKSTWFEPKLRSGLLIHELDE